MNRSAQMKAYYEGLVNDTEQTYGQFMAAYRALEAEGMKAIVFDLRDNGGGLVSSVTAILDQLLPKGIITYTVDRQGYRDEYTSDAHCILDIPAAVLTNENTASASEIFVGAVQYYEKATIVGTTTFGKGIVQVILPLSDGSGMKITTSASTGSASNRTLRSNTTTIPKRTSS